MAKPVNILVEERSLQDEKAVMAALALYRIVAHRPWQEAMSKLARLRYMDLALFWQVVFSVRWCGSTTSGMFSTLLDRSLGVDTCVVEALFKDPGEIGYDGDFVVFSLNEDPKQCSIDLSSNSTYEFPEYKLDKFTTFEEAVDVAREEQQKLIYEYCFESVLKTGFNHVFGILSCVDFLLWSPDSEHKLTPGVRVCFEQLGANYGTTCKKPAPKVPNKKVKK